MVSIHPFRALRPRPDVARQVSCVPYDVPYDREVREEISANPLSFLRVTRTEAEFPPDEQPTQEAVFAASKRLFEEFIADGVLAPDPELSVYVYRLEIGSHRQTGIVACCSVDEYEKGVIKKHERTRPDKVADRTDHMIAIGAQSGIILLAFRETPRLLDLISETASEPPVLQFDIDGDASQTVWKAARPDAFVDAFGEVASLYVADGHHRIESARLARDLRAANGGDAGEAAYVMAGIFPACDLKILPYNRAVRDLNGLSHEEFLSAISENFSVSETPKHSTPAAHGEVCMYLAGAWYTLHSRSSQSAAGPIDSLDVSILQNGILQPVLGIEDPRTDRRISFIGGGRGVAELMRLVDSGEAAVAFSLFPTSMDDLFAVSDAGEIMPPKSTWFEPKLKDGLFVHRI